MVIPPRQPWWKTASQRSFFSFHSFFFFFWQRVCHLPINGETNTISARYRRRRPDAEGKRQSRYQRAAKRSLGENAIGTTDWPHRPRARSSAAAGCGNQRLLAGVLNRMLASSPEIRPMQKRYRIARTAKTEIHLHCDRRTNAITDQKDEDNVEAEHRLRRSPTRDQPLAKGFASSNRPCPLSCSRLAPVPGRYRDTTETASASARTDWFEFARPPPPRTLCPLIALRDAQGGVIDRRRPGPAPRQVHRCSCVWPDQIS